MDKIEKIEGQISAHKSVLNDLQSQYRRLTGMSYNGMPVSIQYEYEFDYEEHFKIRFNYISESFGDEWTPGTPEEMEIVQVLFFGEPLTVFQERAFIEENWNDLEECCWHEYARHQDNDRLNDIFDNLAQKRRAI